VPKVKAIYQGDSDEIYGYRFACPGCNEFHLPVVDNRQGGPQWEFNGDLDHPTFSPSILGRARHGDEPSDRVCHSFVRDGRIEFLGDCTHHLAGQTVELPEVEA
jgi:hypothetical protein